MVETIWIKLLAPHAVIEPVSEPRARNGIFCCRDRAAKWAHSARLHEQRLRLPETSADMSLRMHNYRVWVVVCAVIYEPVSVAYFPTYGNKQGKFANSGAFCKPHAHLTPCFWVFLVKIPVQHRREFFERPRENISTLREHKSRSRASRRPPKVLLVLANMVVIWPHVVARIRRKRCTLEFFRERYI
jgi:hypothetical protein